MPPTPRRVPNPKPDAPQPVYELGSGHATTPVDDTRSKAQKDRCINPACLVTCSEDCPNLKENIDWERAAREDRDPLEEDVVMSS
jgi:hypothetical protein